MSMLRINSRERITVRVEAERAITKELPRAATTEEPISRLFSKREDKTPVRVTPVSRFACIPKITIAKRGPIMMTMRKSR